MKKHPGFWLLGITGALALALGVVLAVPASRQAFLKLIRGESGPDDGPRGGEHRHDGKTLREWVEQLESGDAQAQHSACLALQYFSSEEAVTAVPDLVPLLKSEERFLRS